MTTIIYCHKTNKIAIDSRVSNDNTIVSDNFKKYQKSGDRVYFFSGATCDYPRIAEILDNYHNGSEVDSGAPISAGVIFSENGKAYKGAVTDKGEVWFSELLHSEGQGSGRDFALAALDHGKTARDSVKYASTRCMYTGGKIVVFDVEKDKFVSS